MHLTILRFDELGSTNTEALEHARRGADEGLCVVARRQTAGRGRLGRRWVSERDAGLFFSLLLRPRVVELRFLPLVTLMCAAAVHDALEELYRLDCDIKWVNDIHVGDRKICGILAETTDTPTGLAVVAGIGVNLNSTDFPPAIAATATSIEEETGGPPDGEALLEKLILRLSEFYNLLKDVDGPRKIREEWTRRSSYAFGKRVRVVLENETIHGITCGIEENGALRVRLASGGERVVHAGDVERLREDK
ncbi:MAG: biotin--[acetyl-CoA-carboxylase] ligase [Acidobacteria bacterium]|nr:biotin--[acetyl-CoA-carboxylase] ligase [Acidobacteriota bacterium]